MTIIGKRQNRGIHDIHDNREPVVTDTSSIVRVVVVVELPPWIQLCGEH